MRQRWTEKLKQAVRPSIYRMMHWRKQAFECPICGYRGPFKDKRNSLNAKILRKHTKCVGCGSVERHRIQYLAMKEVFESWSPAGKKVLHIAPEFCLQPLLTSAFETYHTADLHRKDVDFQENIQSMSFPDASYDCICMSAVLVYPPDLEQTVRELRRVLRPGGIAFLTDDYTLEKTDESRGSRASRTRILGLDLLDLYRRVFSRVDCFLASRYDPKYQLVTRTFVDGQLKETAPEQIRLPGVGAMGLVAICHA